MGKFVIRIGYCGFAIACIFFAFFQWHGRSASFPRAETLLWPTSILFVSRQAGTAHLYGVSGFFAVIFAALMNGAYYAGLAWLVWWAARLAGLAKKPPGARGRFISLFLSICLAFAALVALAEAAIHRPKLTAQGLLETYLVSANLFGLIVLACALSGWAMWWFRDFLSRRGAGAPSR
jgi:hypothetical protein